MDLADKVMHVATPGLRSPRSVRDGDEVPLILAVATHDELLATAARRAAELVQREDAGRAAIICPDDLVNDMSAALDAASLPHGRAQAAGLDQGLSIVPASLAKGLELDDVIVVEPTAIVADDAQGLRLLYVTLTRSTRSLTVVHAVALPDAML
jgi:DNA helicase IV